MAFDLFDLAGSWLDILLARRLFVPLAVSILIALGVYFLGGKDPAAAAAAFAIGLVGLCIGIIWHVAGGKSGAA